MTEVKPETVTAELQPELATWLEDVHRLAFLAFGSNGRLSSSVEKNEGKGWFAELADITINKFSTLYHQLPEGHHLEIGLPPGRYQELAGNDDIKLLCHTDRAEQGPTYWLSVAARIDSPKSISPGRSVLNLLPVGTNALESPQARLDLAMITNKGQIALSPSIYPEEILALHIVPDGLPKVR